MSDEIADLNERHWKRMVEDWRETGELQLIMAMP